MKIKSSIVFILCIFLAGLAERVFFTNLAFAALKDNQEIAQIEAEAKKLSAVWQHDAFVQSFRLYEKAAKYWSNLGNSQNAAKCLREASKLKLMLNEVEAAHLLLQKALDYEKKTKNIKGESETLSYLTLIALKRKNTTEAESYSIKSLNLAEIVNHSETLARAFFAAGEISYIKRNTRQMIEFQEKALQLFRQAEDKLGEAETLTYLSYSYVMNNDLIKGKDFAQQSVNIQREIINYRGLAFALIALGNANERMGDWQTAYGYFKEAEKLFPDNVDLFEKAILYDRFGVYFETFGDLKQAQTYYQKSQKLFQQTDDDSGNSQLLTVLGQISQKLGEFELALEYYNQGLKISQKAKDPYTFAFACEHIGQIYQSLGNHTKALEYFQQALTNFEKVGIKHSIASVYEKFGNLYRNEGKIDLARKNYLAALEINREILSKSAQAQNFFDLANLSKEENWYENSLEEIKNSINLTETLHNETANSQIKRSHLSKVFERYELYISLLMRMDKRYPKKNYALEALQVAEKSRARVMLENLSLSEANFTKDADPETVRREKEIRILLNSKADKLIDLLSKKAEKSETDKLSGEINELENELEDIRGRLKQQSPIYSAIKNPAPFDVADFQKNVLDDDSILLEFSLGAEESYLWLVGKTEISAYVLPPREAIETRVETLRALLKERELKPGEAIEDFQTRTADAETRYNAEAGELSRQLFGQIAEKISNKRLIIVPDGELHYFPLGALPHPSTEEPILLTNEIVYEPSAQTLAVLTKIRKQTSAAKNLLVFSDPVFSPDDARFGAGNNPLAESDTAQAERFRFVESLNNLVRLSASKDESETIIKTVGSADNYSGFAATRENLLNLNTGEYKILHFATHGLTDEERPELSGIVLSRYDEKGRKLNEFFRIQDIYALNLNADLVVLSACATGVGKEVKGEGLMSLNNAFLQTGAKTVVSSLWKVEDGATLELMKHFYAAMADENLTPAEALRRAQIKLRENPQYKSPFFWAAFTASGDFRSVPQISGAGYGVWVYLLPVLPLGLIGFYLYRRRFAK